MDYQPTTDSEAQLPPELVSSAPTNQESLHSAVTSPTPIYKQLLLSSIISLDSRLKLALVIFSLVGLTIVMAFPSLIKFSPATDKPSLLLLASVSISLTILTSILLFYASKRLKLGYVWLILAIGYNAVIIGIKFYFVPISLYSHTYVIDPFSFNPSSPNQFVLVALWVAIFYLVLFALVYKVFQSKIKKVLTAAVVFTPASKPRHSKYIIFIATIVVIILMPGLILLPLFFSLPVLMYLSRIFSDGGIALLLAGIAGVALCVGAFYKATAQAIHLRDATIVASFFTLGLLLILIYHGLWVVYLAALANIWPFKTFASSSK